MNEKKKLKSLHKKGNFEPEIKLIIEKLQEKLHLVESKTIKRCPNLFQNYIGT